MLLNKKKKKKRSIRNHEIRIYRRKKKIDKIFELELDQRSNTVSCAVLNHRVGRIY